MNKQNIQDMIRYTGTITLAIFSIITLTCFGQEDQASVDWPQWRGPDISGKWLNGPAVTELSTNSIREIWAVEVGPGYCGPTVASGRIYLMDYLEGDERVLCYSAADGRKLWEHRYPCTYSVGYPTGPRASVLIHNGLAYSFGTMGDLYCLDAASGEIMWYRSSIREYDSRIPIWGMAASPVIHDDLLIVMTGGTPGACLVAFNRLTGKEVWRALDDEASYASPIFIYQAEKKVLVCWTGGSISGLNPADGSVYWTLPFTPRKSIMNVATPVYSEPYLFLSGFFDGSYLVELDLNKMDARLVYHRIGESERETDALHCCISTPVIRDGFVYGIDSYGEVRCLDLKSGERIWENTSLVREGRWSTIHFVEQDDLIWGFTEEGELILGSFSPTGYSDHGRAKVIDPVRISPNPRNGVCWAHPAFSGNRIYLRSDNMLNCVEITEK